MSLKSLLHLGQKIAEKRRDGADSAPDLPRQDSGLPLGARIGGVIEVENAPFVIAQASGSLVRPPSASERFVAAVSRVKLTGLSGKAYRYYLATGDEGAGETFLQTYLGEDGKIREILYCTHLHRLVPTPEERKFFTAEDGTGLGMPYFSLSADQLKAAGVDENLVALATGETGVVDYRRDVDPDAEFVAPLKGSESRIDDAQGEHGLKQEVFYLPYCRQLGDSGLSEFLLISTEIVESRDGDSSKREVHVDFMVAIPLTEGMVNVL